MSNKRNNPALSVTPGQIMEALGVEGDMADILMEVLTFGGSEAYAGNAMVRIARIAGAHPAVEEAGEVEPGTAKLMHDVGPMRDMCRGYLLKDIKNAVAVMDTMKGKGPRGAANMDAAKAAAIEATILAREEGLVPPPGVIEQFGGMENTALALVKALMITLQTDGGVLSPAFKRMADRFAKDGDVASQEFAEMCAKMATDPVVESVDLGEELNRVLKQRIMEVIMEDMVEEGADGLAGGNEDLSFHIRDDVSELPDGALVIPLDRHLPPLVARQRAERAAVRARYEGGVYQCSKCLDIQHRGQKAVEGISHEGCDGGVWRWRDFGDEDAK